MENLLCCPEGNRPVLTKGKVQWVTKLYCSEDTVSKTWVHTSPCNDSLLKSVGCVNYFACHSADNPDIT